LKILHVNKNNELYEVINKLVSKNQMDDFFGVIYKTQLNKKNRKNT